MASLTRKNRSPYWFACYTLPDGTRTKRSTKQTEKRPAMAMAIELENVSRRAQQGRLTEAQARAVISDIVERACGEPLTFYTAADWFNGWLAGKEQSKSKGTHVRYAQVLRGFVSFLGKRAQLNLAQLGPKDIANFREAEIAKGKGAKTCNCSIKTISAALNAARRQGYITNNPAEALEALPQMSGSKDCFSSEQLSELFKAAPSKDWKGAILLAHYTGARLQDVANLRYGAIDFGSKILRYVPQKTRKSGKEITIPLHPQLESFLLDLPGSDSEMAFLFPSLAQKQTGGGGGLSNRFTAIMTAAGIDPKRALSNGGSGRAVSKLSFHSLRHGFNSAMANRGVAQEIRQKLTGHASPEMNKVYTHHEAKQLRDAITVIPPIDLA